MGGIQKSVSGECSRTQKMNKMVKTKSANKRRKVNSAKMIFNQKTFSDNKIGLCGVTRELNLMMMEKQHFFRATLVV